MIALSPIWPKRDEPWPMSLLDTHYPRRKKKFLRSRFVFEAFRGPNRRENRHENTLNPSSKGSFAKVVLARKGNKKLSAFPMLITWVKLWLEVTLLVDVTVPQPQILYLLFD